MAFSGDHDADYDGPKLDDLDHGDDVDDMYGSTCAFCDVGGSFTVLMQPVGAFITYIVWQNYSIRTIKLLL
ncbi:hypothetical protein V6N13_028529 [Hibiscus sabdariffa]